MTTIYALSTVFGKSGVAVFRVSGPDALNALNVLGVKIGQLQPRFAYSARLCDGDQLVDEVVIIYFASPASFTGEDVIEIHSHGSVAVLRYITEKLSTCFIPAGPGEFTRRAVLNNKMDLTKAEGIMDLINAETSIQLKQASRHLSGELSQEYKYLRAQMVKILSYLEAYIDFPDEELPETIAGEVRQIVESLKTKISRYLEDGKVGEKIREGFTVAILGKPNVGKSTLFNYLAKRDLAIVTNIPGTTRDILEVKLDCHGYPIVLLDTAGVQETDDIIEKEGIARAMKSASEADVIIFLVDIAELCQLQSNSVCKRGATIAGHHNTDDLESIPSVKGNPASTPIEEDIKRCSVENNQLESGNIKYDAPGVFSELLVLTSKRKVPIIKVATKADSLSDSVSPLGDDEYMLISVHREQGVQALLDEVFRIISSMDNEAYIITRQRHRSALQNALTYLRRFSLDSPIELAAEEIRLAANEVGNITGEIALDEVLDEIFSTFCIGK